MKLSYETVVWNCGINSCDMVLTVVHAPNKEGMWAMDLFGAAIHWRHQRVSNAQKPKQLSFGFEWFILQASRVNCHTTLTAQQHISSQGSPCCVMTTWMVRFHPWFSPRIRVVSRVLDQELMCASKEKIQDPMRNTKWNGSDEFPRPVLSRCCIILRACGNKCIYSWRNMRTVQALLQMKMSILLEYSIKHGAFRMVA